MTCPVCGNSRDIFASIGRDSIPVLQNRVYSSRAEALSAPSAPFRLATCSRCGFTFNGLFDPGLVVYDEHYDNDVPSSTFRAYYKDMALMLIDKFKLESGVVYDIGCGKGDFLRVLCELAPGIQGVGIDPSCESGSMGNFSLEQRAFDADFKLSPDTRLVILRHVLEHIDTPVAFAAEIRKTIGAAPFYVEVPDLHWMLRNEVFWDFLYEHCNYFSPNTLRYALNQAGFEVEDQQTSFNGQYQWAICRAAPAGAPPADPEPAAEIERVTTYLAREAAQLRSARALVGEAGNAVLWGMASKGVIFSVLMGGGAIAGGIDVNPKKQGRFAPASGVEIHDPRWLASLSGDTTVFIMNGNYAAEIRQQIAETGAVARTVVLEEMRPVQLADASGQYP